MEIEKTILEGCVILKPKIFNDGRGYFFESHNEAKFNEVTGTATKFVQDNQSFSTYGVLRGLHAQSGEYAQAKLVRVLSGEVLDVAVDARPGSATFGQYVAVRLSAENNLQLFIPRGFLHGFVVLSETAVFSYKCDNYYNKESEKGVIYDDPAIGIDWLVKAEELELSEKDLILPTLAEAYSK
ncbi:dTDP-4-dehydrorhamnose 3,5-epimerase [Flavobacterium sp. DG1-102-2]|uniref:dTDP-4-dehydrorhamnose 3,5-epimerase n=1 Tax=Flavobacterium sp. DG1-102-2 TaxID=3081663 RepID=UPI00294A2FEB|nr:dTDP-4-dehydrorhamnose 3,5-epimerase [Flavobacterium sp. DG1-102-2]MDV6168369.1 dTDP-4-dehydrorhamnose 3,5-epimerase [Flavobacterium sp. DG1-102-2]